MSHIHCVFWKGPSCCHPMLPHTSMSHHFVTQPNASTHLYVTETVSSVSSFKAICIKLQLLEKLYCGKLCCRLAAFLNAEHQVAATRLEPW